MTDFEWFLGFEFFITNIIQNSYTVFQEQIKLSFLKFKEFKVAEGHRKKRSVFLEKLIYFTSNCGFVKIVV